MTTQQFLNQKSAVKFHEKDYGWNYGYQRKGSTVRVFRYWTNGHVNENLQFSEWQDEIPESTLDCQRLMQ